MHPIAWFVSALVLMMGLMTLLWAVARRIGNWGVVDVGWAGGLGALAMLLIAFGPGEAGRRLLLGGMLAAWAIRLTGYIWLNRVWKRPEDGRYQRLRHHWGARAPLHFLWFFQAQAVLAVLFSVPVWLAMRRPEAFPAWSDLAAIPVWLLALTGEAVADAQLARFRADPASRGRTFRGGLWRLSRHPNYFFEWLHWWTYVVAGLTAPAGWLTLGGPVLMYVFLHRVTGIPHTEQQALASRGDDYRRYQRETPAFFPWFPRKERARSGD